MVSRIERAHSNTRSWRSSIPHRALQLLTYLNGGALVAIPTALAFFKADVGRLDVLWTAGAFVLGLFFAVLAQGAAFFTMAKRAEAATFFFEISFQGLMHSGIIMKHRST